MLNCCSHDKSEAEATNDGEGVQEKATGGYPKITKAAKKRAAKRRGQARSEQPMSCLLLTCILVWPTAVTVLFKGSVSLAVSQHTPLPPV